MQPLQESIKKQLIKHPFRTIEIIYEAGKTTLTAEDEALIAGFTRLHDFELELINNAQKLHQQSESVNKEILPLKEELKKVRTTFDICCTLADKLSEASYLVEETSLEKLQKARMRTERELKDYHEKLLNIYETAKVVQEKINEYNTSIDKERESKYDQFETLVLNHSINWENNTINIAKFDEQFSQFNEYSSMTERQRDTLMSECDSTMDNYTNLNNETTALYSVWNEFIKRIDLLARMSELHTKATGFTEN